MANKGFLYVANRQIFLDEILISVQSLKRYNPKPFWPRLREAVLMNFESIRFSILPKCYNEHGFASMLHLDQKIKIIHERIRYEKGVLTPPFAAYETMGVFVNKINKSDHNRFYIPKIGIISYRYSPMNVLLYIKKHLGYKRVSKNK